MPQDDQLIGKYSDSEVARLLVRDVNEISRRRRTLGLPSAKASYRMWSDRELLLLGTAPDREIARRLKRSLASVQCQRARLKIPLQESARYDWSHEATRLLGTMSDEDAAKRLGISAGAVFMKRKHLKIAPFVPCSRLWTKKEIRLLGRFSDQETARRLGRTLQAVRSIRNELGIENPCLLVRPWTDAETKLLGTMPDQLLAKKLPRSLSAIRKRRDLLDVAYPFRLHRPTTPDISVLPPPAPEPARASRPKARNGKIARLPKLERDLVNLMLQNNLAHSKIVDALSEHGIRVSERNVFNWKTSGGYKEWAAEHNQAISLRLHQDNLTEYLRKNDAGELPEIGLQQAATQLSEFFLKPEARQQLATDPQAYSRAVAMLCRLARQIHVLQKHRDDSAKALGYRHDPIRIKRQREKCLENTRDVYSSFIPENAPVDPVIPHRNFIPRESNELMEED
jgi:hypothetical protein